MLPPSAPDPYDELGRPPIGPVPKDIKDRIRQIHIRDGRLAAAEFACRQILATHFAGMPNDQMSGETDLAGRISKAGDRSARSLLLEAANALMRAETK